MRMAGTPARPIRDYLRDQVALARSDGHRGGAPRRHAGRGDLAE
jgi:hypothetical protein